MISVMAISVPFLSKISEYSSWTRLLTALTWLTAMMYVRPFVGLRIGAMTAEKLGSADCDLIQMMESDSFGV